MSPRDHSKKVMAEKTKEKEKSAYRCDNCGATFRSEAEKHSHHQSQHAEEYEKHQAEEERKAEGEQDDSGE